MKITVFKRLLIAGLIILVSFPAVAEEYDFITLTSSQLEVIQQGVRGKLNDPYSAKFNQYLAARIDANLIVVCGDVNAKNSFGGYTGYRTFIGELVNDKEFNHIGIIGRPLDQLHFGCWLRIRKPVSIYFRSLSSQ